MNIVEEKELTKTGNETAEFEKHPCQDGHIPGEWRRAYGNLGGSSWLVSWCQRCGKQLADYS